MNPLPSIACISCIAVLASCGGSGRPDAGPTASNGLSDRLNRNYGYQVDGKGNWVPKSDKRSQYEGRGSSGYFDGSVSKKSFGTKHINKGSWMGNKEVNPPVHRVSGSNATIAGDSRFGSQQASLGRRHQAPERITGNRIPDQRAIETGGRGAIGKPSDAETDSRRRVFVEPDIIDYKQQRELSIRESKRLLGRDE